MQRRAGTAAQHSRRAALGGLCASALLAAGCAASSQFMHRVDEGHASLCRGLADVVDGVDRAFGEPRVEDRARIVRAKLGAAAELRENRDFSLTVPVSLRVPLPALERRANIFLQFESVSDASGDIDQARSTFEDNKTLSATILTRLGGRLDTGARLDLYWEKGLQTGTRPFVRWEWRPEPVHLFFEQQLYLLTDLGFGAKSLLQLDRVLGGASFLRLAGSVEGNQETPGAELRHTLIYRRPISGYDAAISAELGAVYNAYNGDPLSRARGSQDDPDEAFVQARVIGRIFRPWIEYEIAPALHRPWRHSDELEFGITFTVRLVAEHPLAGPADQ